MGFTRAWAVTSHPGGVLADLAPQLLPAMRADRARPQARSRRREWQRAPLPDFRTWYARAGGPVFTPADAAVDSFRGLTAPGRHIDDVCDGTADPAFYVVDDVWDGRSSEEMFLSIHRKEYAVASFFHAIGPTRAALLPGWCGNFLLTAAQVARDLPRVERALSMTVAERAAAVAQDWLDYSPGEETVLDGPLRVWRAASRRGHGLCGPAVPLS